MANEDVSKPQYDSSYDDITKRRLAAETSKVLAGVKAGTIDVKDEFAYDPEWYARGRSIIDNMFIMPRNPDPEGTITIRMIKARNKPIGRYSEYSEGMNIFQELKADAIIDNKIVEHKLQTYGGTVSGRWPSNVNPMGNGPHFKQFDRQPLRKATNFGVQGLAVASEADRSKYTVRFPITDYQQEIIEAIGKSDHRITHIPSRIGKTAMFGLLYGSTKTHLTDRRITDLAIRRNLILPSKKQQIIKWKQVLVSAKEEFDLISAAWRTQLVPVDPLCAKYIGHLKNKLRRARKNLRKFNVRTELLSTFLRKR